MKHPEEHVIEGLEAIAAAARELERRSERVLARRLEEAGRQMLHAFIEISSRKENPSFPEPYLNAERTVPRRHRSLPQRGGTRSKAGEK